MKIMLATLPGLLLLTVAFYGGSAPASQAEDKNKSAATTNQQSAQKHEKAVDEDTMRLEGEKRYSANCGRCHQAPHKLPPRMMATAVRHMRVRAMLTDEDMRYILWYMTR